jgi:hypothetical protein
VPRPKVTIDYAENEKAMREEIHRLAREIFDAAGAPMNGFVISERNASASVVDPNFRSHDHPNLFVCDANVLPTPGGHNLRRRSWRSRLARHLDGSRWVTDHRGLLCRFSRKSRAPQMGDHRDLDVIAEGQ